MTKKTRENGKKRVILKWWQKLLLIAGCTGLCVLAAWLLCEKYLEPAYVDTVRTVLEIDREENGALDTIKSQNADFLEDVLDIRGNLTKEDQPLANPSKNPESRGGQYYKLLYETLKAQYPDIKTIPRDLKNMISTSAVKSDDGNQETIRIRLEDKNGKLTDAEFRTMVCAAGEQFSVVIFGEPAGGDRMTTAVEYRGNLKDGVDKDPANYTDDDYIWVAADPADESIQKDVWAVTVTISKAAIDALPSRGSFYNRQLDLRELLAARMTDDDYRQIAADAGVNAKPEEIRKAISFLMTGDENTIEIQAAWAGGQDEAVRILEAAAKRAADAVTRAVQAPGKTFAVVPENKKFRVELQTAAGDETPWAEDSYAPWLAESVQWEVVTKAGAYTQAFYSDRPQFKTDMKITADVRVLGLKDCFESETGAKGTSSGLFGNLAQSWGRKEFLDAESRKAFAGLTGGGDILYVLNADQVRDVFTMEEDAGDPTGRTLVIAADTEPIITDIRTQIENKCAANEQTLRASLEKGEIDEETFGKAVELLNSQKATVLEAVDRMGENIRESVVLQLDNLFFGYTGEKDDYRTVRYDAGRIVYAITDTGLDHLKDDCYSRKTEEPVSLQGTIQALDSGNGYQQILQEAGADGSGDALKSSMAWEGEESLTLNIHWSDKTTTGEIGKNAMTVLSRQLTKETAGRPMRLVISESKILREQARTRPPATLPTMVIVGLIALVLSYIIFSGQPLFDSLVIVFFVIFTFICIFPFYYLFINTISDNTKVAAGRINFLPEGIHLKNYQRIFSQQELGDAALVTIARTILGTALMVLTSAWAGYLVTKRKMWRRSFWYRALVVTMYFNAGLIPWYTNMLMLGLTNNFLAYIIPGMVAPYNIILVKTYIESIPGSLEESAIIDGASTGKVFLRIILPLSVPILATIAIFGAVGNWNSFQDSLLLMGSAPHLYTLQHRLYIYLNQTTSINTEQISEQMAQNLMNNGVTTKYTIAMVTIIPILLVYPIMQRYFVKGIMLGAVKG